jgi:2-polyprenyl-3-methyl-5-hydroxy-6-metoxy-1,4-benzoquinol methylase
MDMAASIQKVTEEAVLRMAKDLRAKTGMRNLCMAGGVALNCVANGRILQEKIFDNVWIQPAADDAGGALGVALFIWYQLLQNEREVQRTDLQKGSLLGPAYSDWEIGSFLKNKETVYEYVADDESLCARVAESIAAGKVVGWFQGRMEFGPRALGNRSILGDARNRDMQTLMNMKVKFRESFRPFAPVVLREHVHEYFDWPTEHESPYMLLVAPVRYEKRIALPPKTNAAEGLEKLKQYRSQIPAATHVDYSARVQTVDQERHGLFRKLMEAFYRQTGCPIMINTSFNLGWDPIVCSPSDAYDTFMSSDIDLLCMGHYVLTKADQSAYGGPSGSGPKDSLRDLLCSPCHQAELAFEGERAVCTVCKHAFKNVDGIWSMYWPHDEITKPEDVTEKVKAFYEETPFPNYDEHDSLRSLIDKARRGVYAQTLDRSVPYNTTVLEVGCGTGQLSNFLGIGLRRVIGADLCLNSLRLGERFRHDNGLNRVKFIQMNLFRTCLKAEQFDVILCNGVLHHTADPFGGYRRLLPLLKVGGYIVIGLYNRYGRLMTDMRRRAFQLTGNRGKWIDPILRSGKRGGAQDVAWFADQYCHPHESKHTIDEVLRWFEETGIEFVRGVPSVTPGSKTIERENLFSPEPLGTTLDHWLVERREIVRGNREGGFFIMIGRKPKPSGSTSHGSH